MRIRDVLAVGADTVATACPFCLQMLEDALRTSELEEAPEVLDLVELLERAVMPPAIEVEAASVPEVGAVAGAPPFSAVGSRQGGRESAAGGT